jgi:glutamine phosphoribosylpyrophosphate amidotransferase
MHVRKVRGQNKVGKIVLTATEVAVVRKMGMVLEDYVKHALLLIAKERRWKWYFNKENT